MMEKDAEPRLVSPSRSTGPVPSMGPETLEPTETATSQPAARGEEQDLPDEFRPRPVVPASLPREIVDPANALVTISAGPTAQVRMRPSDIADLLGFPNMPERDAFRLLMFCRETRANPFQKEVYVDARPTEAGRIDYNFIVSKWYFIRRAAEHPDYGGYEYHDFPPVEQRYVPPVWGECTVKRAGRTLAAVRLYFDAITNIVGKGGAVQKKRGYCQASPRRFLKLMVVAEAHRLAFPETFSRAYALQEIQE